MKKFFKSVSVILKRGGKILIYPEQAMWWNYRKPRPMKNGAFRLAAKNNAPILPCFITMEDSEIIGADGFPLQNHTIHILPPIFANKELSKKEQIEDMKERNYQAWVKVYEETYGKKLEYTTANNTKI